MSRGNELIYFDVDVFKDALDAACDETAGLVKKAIYSTMGKVRQRARTEVSNEIRKKWNIKKKDLDKRLRVRAGERGHGYETFELIIKGQSISLSYFGARQYAGNRVITRTMGRVNKRASRFQGVQVEVIKGRRTQLPGAFMQAAGSGHVMVMKRTGKSRYPVAIKAVISPASMFSDSAIYDRFTDQLMADLERIFAHELEYRLTKDGYL